MAYKCPNCGGHVHYSISNKLLVCDFCDSQIPIESEDAYVSVGTNKKNGKGQLVSEMEGSSLTGLGGSTGDASGLGKQEIAEEHETMGITSFVCKNCGAELLTPDETMISYCSYCGSEAMLEGRLDTEIRPKFILPFQKSKKECKDEYLKRTKGLFFVPKELKDTEYLEKFRGTYIPYWLYRVEFPDGVKVKATRKTRHSGEITETTYDVETKIKGDYYGVPYDASSCFDDTISDMLMPFDKKKLKKFHPGYLAGFYADRADVPASKYFSDASKRSAINAYDSVGRDIKRDKKLDIDKISDEKKVMQLNPEIRDSSTALFPIWFLTWRNRKRVAYAIVNGQSGKLSCDIPVDMKTYSIWTILIALGIFAVLTLLVSMTAKTALMICAFLTLIIMILFNRETKEIRDRENHIYDRGYFVKGRTVRMSEKKRDRIAGREKRSLISILSGIRWSAVSIVLIYFIGAGLVSIFQSSPDLDPGTKLLATTFIFAVIGTIKAISSARVLRYIKEKTMALYNLIAWAAIVGAFFVAAWEPVHDYYYYIACALCGLGAAITSVGLIRYYNLLTTRPIPTFFDREGGRDNAKY